MIIESSFTYEGKNVSVRYEDADSFDHLPLVKVTQAYAVCFLGDDMVIVKNGKKNTWGLPGGTREDGESLIQCLKREVLEETGMKVVGFAPIGYQNVGEGDSMDLQVRYVCTVRKVREFTGDTGGAITEVKVINPKQYREYFDWGDIGKHIIDKASKKALKDLSSNTYANHRQLLSYSPKWKELFEMEETELRKFFPDARIEHVGSTSVEGLSAKPIIDIVVLDKEEHDFSYYVEKLMMVGYTPNLQSSERHFFTKGDPIHTHLSIALPQHGDLLDRQVRFRDYLRTHADARKEYEQVKQDSLRADPTGYTTYVGDKSAFIDEILSKATEE